MIYIVTKYKSKEVLVQSLFVVKVTFVISALDKEEIRSTVLFVVMFIDMYCVTSLCVVSKGGLWTFLFSTLCCYISTYWDTWGIFYDEAVSEISSLSFTV